MIDKESKSLRILDILDRFNQGKIINKAQEAQRFNVDERTIQRDIDDIRAFISEKTVSDDFDNRSIIYDRVKKGFVMVGSEHSTMSNSEILAVSKILLDSRAFTKDEINSLLDKIIAGCVPFKSLQLVSDLISNERFHYVELRHKSSVKDYLWELGEQVKNQNLIKITYQKQINSDDIIKRVVEPVGIIFSEYYFYLNAYIVEKNGAGEYVHIYDYPAIFRIDRILKYSNLNIKFRVPYVTRFEEGNFRNKIQFMFAGKLIKIQFKYTGNSVDSILDRLPNANVIKKSSDGCLIEAEVFGNGIMMWLLSQGDMVEIIKPESMRTDMKNLLTKMLEKY